MVFSCHWILWGLSLMYNKTYPFIVILHREAPIFKRKPWNYKYGSVVKSTGCFCKRLEFLPSIHTRMLIGTCSSNSRVPNIFLPLKTTTHIVYINTHIPPDTHTHTHTEVRNFRSNLWPVYKLHLSTPWELKYIKQYNPNEWNYEEFYLESTKWIRTFLISKSFMAGEQLVIDIHHPVQSPLLNKCILLVGQYHEANKTEMFVNVCLCACVFDKTVLITT